jgi:hypothetical protein
MKYKTEHKYHKEYLNLASIIFIYTLGDSNIGHTKI